MNMISMPFVLMASAVEELPESICAARESSDQVLERIYTGKRFRDDNERLEKLFELYTKMTT